MQTVTVIDPVAVAALEQQKVQYDYTNQAWVVDGKYQRCGHTFECRCYGKDHEGEPANYATAEIE